MKLPAWLSKRDCERLKSMDQEDALEEIARLHERELERKRAWNRNKKEYLRERSRQWRAKNPKKARESDAKQRARVNADPDLKAHYASVRRAWLARQGPQRRCVTKEQTRRYEQQRYQRRKARRLAQNKPDKMRSLIQKLLPGYLMAPARADIINSVIALALDHKVRLDQVHETVKQCVAAYNRQFDYFKTISIDAPIAGTDGLTRADLLDSEVMHF